jgi:hypothetical protein
MANPHQPCWKSTTPLFVASIWLPTHLKYSSGVLKILLRLRFWVETYTDRQLINNVICLLLTTGLYVRPFEEWDHMAPATQTWVTLHTLIQEAFQHRLNATAPMAGHHGYAPALPFQQKAFSALGTDVDKDKESIVEGIADQAAALMYQSQLTASTAATTNHCNAQQLATIEANQEAPIVPSTKSLHS